MQKKDAVKMFKNVHWEDVTDAVANNDQEAINALWKEFLCILERSPRGHVVNHNWECPIMTKQMIVEWLDKYDLPENYVKSAMPTKWVEYTIRFTDGTEQNVIMTDPEWNGMRRSKMWDFIWQNEGRGYRTPKYMVK